ncbi:MULTISPECIES: hypothetical protein [Streptomyces]|uniref:Uncharacterized protein n=2 Tax=Streptomyces TaxID=1883 RepID=A0A3M8FC71_9ACTN|nr:MULTISPECIES: hypothetical protein [Streptomyces]KNE83490.1 hypothetical protein ADZ36_05310 [Streptomyces fradiae]OFA61976.1 hypothetical protein BEN35_00685 [Streptomyces fradiae]PQM24300.1 hypothetical protein Sfr7A_05830 [Streptomyces xinghaiensis]RKM97267.1 hypothetical protein SFRA_008515 [Streptomyces xinghaiensis]RNC75338.1 hypothetical protein DC095_006085 [Streptomyces xinghaiensis]
MDRFEAERAEWFTSTYGVVADVLDMIAPDVAAFVPDDLGPRRLVAATALARLAQMDAECQESGLVADFLERLSGGMSYEGQRPLPAVLDLWTALRRPTISLLHSWWREPLAEGLLAFWAERRAESVGWARVHAELRERWSVDTDGIWRRGLMPPEGERDGWVGFLETLDAEAGDPGAAHLVRMFLTRLDGFADEAETFAAERADDLARAPHLDHIHRMRCLAESVGAVAEANRAALDGPGLSRDDVELRATLTDISRVADHYLTWVAKTFVPELTPLERALLDLGGADAQRADDYLQAYARVCCVPEAGAPDTPLFGEEEFAGLKAHERPDLSAPRWMAQGASRIRGSQRGLAWDVGSQPWWIHPVEAGLPSAAALRFKEDGAVRMGCRSLDEAHDFLVGFPAGHPDERTLVMRFQYADDEPLAMCHLLALSRAGRARLVFLTPAHDGGWRVLRMVSVPVQGELRAAMRRKAVAELDRMTGGDPGGLAALLEADMASAATGDAEPREAATEDSAAETIDGALFSPPDTLF